MNQDQDNEKLLIYFEGEEHLVRRLGAALISYWRELPHDLRNKLIQRAESVLDKEHTSHLDTEMRRFIADHTKPR